MGKSITSILDKLDNVLGKKKEAKPKIDFKELDALRAKSFFKFSPGKNQIAVIPLSQDEPFVFWAYHKNLQEKDFWTVPCDKYNKGTECLVCSVIEDLNKEDAKGNNHLSYPIRQMFEFYVPVVNTESEATIAEGAKWLKFGPAIMGHFSTWLSNVDEEAGEKPFYSEDEPQKIIVTYNKGAASPQDVYKVDKKSMRAFTKAQLDEFKSQLLPIETFMYGKTQEQLEKIVAGYFERVAAQAESAVGKKPTNEKAAPVNSKVEDDDDDDDDDVNDETNSSADETETEVVSQVPKKLDFLKRKKA